jgi:uncharacterized RDD family membrane protein YckC
MRLASRTFDASGWLGWLGWLGGVVGAIYEVALTTWRGQTAGEWLAGTRVVDIERGGSPSLGRSVLRAAPALLVLLPVVGVAGQLLHLPVLWRTDRRGWHDDLGRTVVRVADR